MSCEGVRHQLREFSDGLPDGNRVRLEARAIESITRSACDTEGTHTARLAGTRRTEIMEHYASQARQFLVKHGIDPIQ